ncbi:hypothetical protein AF335_09610 [Streptomyces eurocidicus]|uniref:CBM6 domain-containing protein n=1 Tax=Streptomyces eurocidicus TaxID=66423 RepID=A0A2N8NWP8_STREU|nr:CBM35 domain-containing protein [Streptomyces eurocidicus]MBB5118025.1 hypothetical protein [Streptomyces eurocidicus]MBF6054000.1 carbohydrate-binding protein [Streptomyces eurocidicus]PNE33190.1 hypothetical protein AF335_09610 [Streptomyces eurocidicus]
MTAGNNGTGTPENDDPFAHLYRSEGGDGNSADSGPEERRPGVPRTSYHQVRPVGSRQYGPQPPRQQSPAPHYAAPETLPGGAPRQPMPPAAPGGHAPRPKRRGLLIAAIAVVAVVAGGIGVAMMTNSGDGKSSTQAGATGGGDDKPAEDDGKKGDKPKEPEKKQQPSNPSAAGLQKRDAASLRLLGGATTAKDVKGAEADGNTYIEGMNKPGAGIEWEVEVKAAGEYKLNLRYGVPGTDASLSVTTNGKRDDRSIAMRNYGSTAYSEVWYTSWQYVTLKAGKNTVKISCESGNKCESHLDWVSLAPR